MHGFVEYNFRMNAKIQRCCLHRTLCASLVSVCGPCAARKVDVVCLLAWRCVAVYANRMLGVALLFMLASPPHLGSSVAACRRSFMLARH